MSAEDFELEEALEARLRAMRPAELPPSLAESISRAKPRRVHWLAFAAPLAAAAVFMVAFVAWPRAGEGPSALASSEADALEPSDLRVFIPIEEKSTLVGVQDLGTVETNPAQPIRVMRYTWIDDTTFRGDDGQSILRRTEPREQIVPVVLQVF